MAHDGDLLLIFSDGFTEAMNGGFEEFGEERLLEVAARHQERSAAEVVDEMFAAVADHVGGADRNDDMTIVAVKVTH